MTFYQKLQTKINAISISHVFVACTSRFSFFYIRSFYNREPPQERERHKNHYFRLASLLAYENIRFSTLFAAGDVSRPQRRRARRNGCFRRLQLCPFIMLFNGLQSLTWGGGGLLIRSDGSEEKYELKCLKHLMKILINIKCYVLRSSNLNLFTKMSKFFLTEKSPD